MLRKIFRKVRPDEARPKAGNGARAAENQRVYCIGDIHGRSDLLEKVARWVAEDARSAPQETVAIFLGDYVDRGPDSAGVLERLSARDFPIPIRSLSGNHEQMFLNFLENIEFLDDWRRYGGLETLHSYGVPVAAVMRGEKFDDARRALLERLPSRHLDFLKACELSAESGDYFFCHAGVRPDLPLSRQEAADLLWIRQPFLGFDGSFGKRVVHGHTPVERVDIRANRINIDTGAFATGNLSCLAIEADTLRVFTTE